MFETQTSSAGISADELIAQASALVSGQNDIVANAANLSSLLFYALEEVNWPSGTARQGPSSTTWS